MGFLVAGLCYLSYRYITKPPPPPNSLVSRGPGEDGEAEGRARAPGPRLSLISPSNLKMWLATPPVCGRELGRRKTRHGIENPRGFKGAHTLSEPAAQVLPPGIAGPLLPHLHIFSSKVRISDCNVKSPMFQILATNFFKLNPCKPYTSHQQPKSGHQSCIFVKAAMPAAEPAQSGARRDGSRPSAPPSQRPDEPFPVELSGPPLSPILPHLSPRVRPLGTQSSGAVEPAPGEHSPRAPQTRASCFQSARLLEKPQPTRSP